ncbi:MAG: iron ABC transporter permease [bacterium]|jgi:iron(III) transport system permease protein|nr:iron ABC transporter permease [bacterium]
MNSSQSKELSGAGLFLNKVRTYFSKPANLIVVIFLVILLTCIIYPLYSVLYASFTVGKMDSMMYNSLFKLHLKPGDFTMLNFTMMIAGKYSHEYSLSFFWRPLWNSVRMSVYSSAIAALVGGVIAWLITRTDIKCKKFISSVFVFPYIMPSWTLALVWKNVFANSKVGTGVTGMLESLTGICVPSWFVYGIFPCAIVMGIHYAPFAYILIGGILRNMDANLEEAATILKAGRWRIIRKVTLPIIMPALFSTILLVFSSTMASYAVPVFVGSPGNFFVLSTMLRSLYSSSYSGQSYVMTLVLVIIGAGMLLLNQMVLGKRKSFTTVTGKSGQVSYVKLGKINNVITAILVVVLFFMAIFPIFSFALESLCDVQGDYSTITLKYWTSRTPIEGFNIPVGEGILFNPRIWGALWGSLKLSFVVAVTVGISGFLIGYGVSKNRSSKLASMLSNVAFFPYLIPAMAFGSIFLAVTSKLVFLRGTFLILVIVASVKYLPFASRSGTSAMMQLSGEIEEAAIIVGAPWHKRMLRILFPIQKSSFISGFLLPFVSCIRELSLFILLTSSGTLITTLLSYFDEKNVEQMSNGINLLIVAIVLIVNFTINKLTGASIDKGIGGN